LLFCNPDIPNLQGQGYDGAAVIAGNFSGVSTQILQKKAKSIVLPLLWA